MPAILRFFYCPCTPFLIAFFCVLVPLISEPDTKIPPLPLYYSLRPPAAMPDNKDLVRSLVENPQDLVSKVTLIRRNDAEICITAQDIHVVYPFGIAKILNVLLDYARYPENFSKVKKSDFVVEGKITRQNQTTSVMILGFEVRSVFTVELIEFEGPKPGTRIIQWYQVASDHSIEAIQGYWYLEEFLHNGKPATYIRYSTATEVPKTIIGQEVFMGLFISAFARDNLIALRAAASK